MEKILGIRERVKRGIVDPSEVLRTVTITSSDLEVWLNNRIRRGVTAEVAKKAWEDAHPAPKPVAPKKDFPSKSVERRFNVMQDLKRSAKNATSSPS